MDTSALMAFVMWHAINGQDKAAIFGLLPELQDKLLHAEVAELAMSNAKWRTAPEECIITLPSRCLWTLEAALWCVYNTSNFEDAVVKAINLGGDADTVGAITGQIAGAIYNVKSIPERWLQGLKHRDSILKRVIALYGHKHYDVGLALCY